MDILDRAEWLQVAAAAAVVIIVLLAVVGALLSKRKRTRNTILLLGINDAGKTALYTSLRFGKSPTTVTSMKENEGPMTVGDKTFELVDMPGHERLRLRYTDYLPVTRGIVFVVDSVTITRQVRAVSEYLYQVLAQKQVQSQHIPVLVACNKTDIVTALNKEKIQERLETEIDHLRTTRTAALEQQGAAEDHEQEAFLGYEGEKFKFDHLDNTVQFESCSALKGDNQRIIDWLTNL